MSKLSRDEIARCAAALGPWFHNIDLGGVQTAPDHFLGDYPAIKWQRFAHAIPEDLSGKTVLDIGCNGGFYSLEMKRRGAARVVAIDHDEDYLAASELRRRDARRATSNLHNCRCTMSARSVSGLTSSCSSGCSTTCAIRCWRSI